MSAAGDAAIPLLEMTGITKSFAGNTVLSGVDLALYAGEVHALVGENGAGKSTLMKILNGVYTADRGSVQMQGRALRIAGPPDARRAGIGMIFQEHTLAEHLTVAENIFLGREPAGRWGLLDSRRLLAGARRILEDYGLPLDPRACVAGLSRGAKQLVEIARALATSSRVIVMDEPTAVLSRGEAEQLFRIIGGLKERGMAVVYISHRMEELGRVADRITILRDGKRVFSGRFDSIDQAGVIRHMVGREVRELYPPLAEPRAEVALETRGAGDGRRYSGVSFQLRRGEILGLAGLVGAGRTELARGIFGLEPVAEGEVLVHGRAARFSSSRQAIASGLGYLSEDRKGSGVFPHLPVAANVSIAALERISRGPFLRLREEARLCRELAGRLSIRAASPRTPVGRLSGGNQQKTLLARWLFAGSGILLADEPTQGVDLPTRAEIYRLLAGLAAGGAAVLMISSDLPELLGMSHRILVMRRGRLAATLDARYTSQEEIMRYAALDRT